MARTFSQHFLLGIILVRIIQSAICKLSSMSRDRQARAVEPARRSVEQQNGWRNPATTFDRHVIDAATPIAPAMDATVARVTEASTRFGGSRNGKTRRLEACGIIPSALVRSAHDLDGVLDMAPFLGLLGVALAFACPGILGGLGDGRGAVPLEHLPCDHVKLRLRHHVALPIVRFPLLLSAGRDRSP